VAKKGTRKGPKARAIEVPSKQPKTTSAAARSSQGDKPTFSFEYADRASNETWAFDLSPEESRALLEFLCEMGRLTWREIEAQQTGGTNRHRKHHDQPIDTLEKKAQEHIAKRRLNETFGDDIFRFRLGGEVRLWGFRDGAVFHVLWWETDHGVYPVD
jgi:hypothetical protein